VDAIIVPAGRIGGGTRSAGAARLALEVVAPDHTGLTSVAQPTLYWYASDAAATPLEFTLLPADAEKPLVERRLPAVTRPGIQAVALASLGVTLKPGTEYEWFVSAVSDPQQRSRDVTAGGSIRRAGADAALVAQLAQADARSVPVLYAQAGYFYDAVESLSRLIDRNPGDAALRGQRAALLEQVGLPKVAEAERAAAGR
jgi:predicted secreted protein